MVVLYILLALVLLVGLIMLIPIDLIFIYEEKTLIKLRVLFISFVLNKEKKRVEKTKEKKVTKTKKTDEPDEVSEKAKLSPKQLINVITKVSAELVKSVRAYLRVYIENLYIDVATPDVMQTSLLYAGATAAAQILIDYLEDNTKLVIKRLHVGVDYCATKLIIKAKIRFRLRVWQITKTLINVAIAYTRSRIPYLQTEVENESA